MRRLLLLCYAILSAPSLAAQSPPISSTARVERSDHSGALVATALRIGSAPRVNGRLDEEVWTAAIPLTQFTQFDPVDGAPASERTEVRLLYTDDALYIGARMHDSAPTRTRLGRRDLSREASDWFGVVLDTHHDHRTAFGFEVNPSGVVRDYTLTDQNEDTSWEPVWEAETAWDSAGWVAEMRIPFSQLRFNGSDEQTWGIQIDRRLARTGELMVFAFTPRDQPGGIPSFGHLTGLRDIPTGKRLELLPYVVASQEHVDTQGNPFRRGRETGASAGADLKYRASSDLTLDATINPDFGHVEVDPAEVNLTAIETRYQEKRPFFVEGSEIFNFGSIAALGPQGNMPFYSRRIGGAPHLRAPSPLSDAPGATRILGAAKLSGRRANGWSIGIFEAVTQRERARFQDAADEVQTIVVEPLSNYFVGRLRRDFRAGRSAVGGMVAALNRDLETSELRRALHSSAYNGGLDFRHDWAGRTWSLRGLASASSVSGEALALLATQQAPWRYLQRPDATHLQVDSSRTSLQGYAAQLQISHQVGRHWSGSALFGAVSPGYEVNDMGYQSRGDRLDGALTGSYQQNRPGQLFRSWMIIGRVAGETNYAGEAVGNGVFVGSTWRLLNFWTAMLNVGAGAGALDDRLTRGGPATLKPGNARVAAALSSDDRKGFVGRVDIYLQEGEDGSRVRRATSSFQAKPFANWSVTLSPSYSWQHTAAQYLTTIQSSAPGNLFGRRYLFAELDQTTLSLETRLNITVNPRLSLQAYAQPFISAANFGTPMELGAPRTRNFLRYGRDIGEVEQTRMGFRLYPEGREIPSSGFDLRERDFNLRSLRGNAVVRWEYRPGSTLYLAWQQDRRGVESIGDFDFGRDQAALFSEEPDNVFVLKLSYWLNP